MPGGNCIKVGLPGKSILRGYFQENRTSQRSFLLLRISFPGRPIFIQFVPDVVVVGQVPYHALLVDVPRLGGGQQGAVLHLVEEVQGGNPADNGHDRVQDRLDRDRLLQGCYSAVS